MRQLAGGHNALNVPQIDRSPRHPVCRGRVNLDVHYNCVWAQVLSLS